MKPRPDKQLILDSLAAIAGATGRAPSRSKFLSLSGFSEHQVSQFFPTWNDAVRAAGLFPHTLNQRLEDRELLEDWAYAVRKKGKIPSRRAYPHLGQYDPRTFQRFGPWSKLPEVFRNFAQGKPEYADVLALLPEPTPRAAQAGSVGARFSSPGGTERASHPRAKPGSRAANHTSPSSLPPVTPPKPVHPETVGARFSASQPFPPPNNDRAPNQQSPSPPAPGKALPSKLRFPPLHGRPTYGQPLDFRGLRHEPVNEQGVVLLFGLVAKELGYIVESIQSGFPDCEAKRQISPKQWQRVHIEFEFESRNFRDHGHPLTGCDIIVCWRHNWPDHPPQIEILELSSAIQSLPTSADGAVSYP